MKPRYGWILKLDAELELARGRPGYVPQRKLLVQLAEHGKGSRALLGPADVLLQPDTDVASASELVGRAWCPTPMALATLRRHGIEPEPHPDAAVLRRVNHRLFGHELGGGLPQQAYVRSEQELLTLVGDYARHWLLKRPLGFAGRGQLRIIGPLTEKQGTWVKASLKRDGLLLEPLVKPTFEVSLHGFVGRGGRHELGRVCAQDISERGAFRGVRLAEPGELSPSEHSAFHERAETVAHALTHAGYFGPFGIDGYRYTLDGASAFCALGEINARYTLGFVTGFPRHPSELSLA
jgi:hypothetical protein